MKISPKGLAHLEQIECRRQKAYKDSGGALTIGVGHLLTPKELRTSAILIGSEQVQWKSGLTTKQIDDLLLQDIRIAEDAINRVVKVALTQNQFDALVSFVFNIGVANFLYGGSDGGHCKVLKLINAGKYTEAADRLQDWNLDNGVVVQGLVNRRRAERELFLEV